MRSCANGIDNKLVCIKEQFDFRKSLSDYFENQSKKDELYEIFDIDELSRRFIKYIRSRDFFYLYRYCPADDFLYDSLKNKNIYLCSNTQFDDIYEGLPADQMNLYRNNTEIVVANKETNLNYRKNVNRESLITSRPEYLFIKCFSENGKNMPMWGLYADKYKGVCLKYNIKKLNDEALKHLFPVVYTDERCAISGVDIEELHDKKACNENVFPIGLFKGKDWSFEKEWRILYQLNEIEMDEQGNYKQNMKFDCLEEIYLGFDILEKDKLWINTIADELHVIVKKQALLDYKFGCDYVWM